MRSLDGACDLIYLVPASIDASLRIVEHAVFGEDLVDGGSPTRWVILTEHFVKVTTSKVEMLWDMTVRLLEGVWRMQVFQERGMCRTRSRSQGLYTAAVHLSRNATLRTDSDCLFRSCVTTSRRSGTELAPRTDYITLPAYSRWWLPPTIVEVIRSEHGCTTEFPKIRLAQHRMQLAIGVMSEEDPDILGAF